MNLDRNSEHASLKYDVIKIRILHHCSNICTDRLQPFTVMVYIESKIYTFVHLLTSLVERRIVSRMIKALH